jgi:hypothetical protein
MLVARNTTVIMSQLTTIGGQSACRSAVVKFICRRVSRLAYMCCQLYIVYDCYVLRLVRLP